MPGLASIGSEPADSSTHPLVPLACFKIQNSTHQQAAICDVTSLYLITEVPQKAAAPVRMPEGTLSRGTSSQHPCQGHPPRASLRHSGAWLLPSRMHANHCT